MVKAFFDKSWLVSFRFYFLPKLYQTIMAIIPPLVVMVDIIAIPTVSQSKSTKKSAKFNLHFRKL